MLYIVETPEAMEARLQEVRGHACMHILYVVRRLWHQRQGKPIIANERACICRLYVVVKRH